MILCEVRVRSRKQANPVFLCKMFVMPPNNSHHYSFISGRNKKKQAERMSEPQQGNYKDIKQAQSQKKNKSTETEQVKREGTLEICRGFLRVCHRLKVTYKDHT